MKDKKSFKRNNVLVIPDVHLKPFMFQQAALIMKSGIAERAVCLMDIPDDWQKQYNIELYVQTFDAAIEFAEEYPDTLWCYGNHELSYMWNELESGYSSFASWTVKEKLLELQKKLPEGNEIRYVHKIDNVIFCHGGIRDDFVRNTVKASKYHDVDAVVNAINELHHDLIWNNASPVWHRPQYWKEKMYKPRKVLQVVGHTPIAHISRCGNVISCDTFSTYRDGKPIGTREFLLINTLTWDYRGITGGYE